MKILKFEELNESKKILTLSDFLNYFSEEEKSWVGATDEIRTIAEEIAEILEIKIFDYKSLRTPSAWNTQYRKFIKDNYYKLKPNEQKRILNLIKDFNFGQNGENVYESRKTKTKPSTDEDFRKFVYDRLKLQFPDNFDENRAEEVVSGLLKVAGGEDGNRNYPQIYGMASHI